MHDTLFPVNFHLVSIHFYCSKVASVAEDGGLTHTELSCVYLQWMSNFWKGLWQQYVTPAGLRRMPFIQRKSPY